MVAKKKREDLAQEFIKGLWRDNPVFVQVLGMCPMLAVTNSAINAVAMGMATIRARRARRAAVGGSPRATLG